MFAAKYNWKILTQSEENKAYFILLYYNVIQGTQRDHGMGISLPLRCVSLHNTIPNYKSYYGVTYIKTLKIN